MSFVPQLNDFIGEWTIDRTIHDRLGASEGEFSGTASFKTISAGLAYREEGQLKLGAGSVMTAMRDYLWRGEAGRIVVDYGDGQPFHDFDPADPSARHWCDPDDYRVRYDFSRWPDWTAEWVVAGPRKDYTMLSRYTPKNARY